MSIACQKVTRAGTRAPARAYALSNRREVAAKALDGRIDQIVKDVPVQAVYSAATWGFVLMTYQSWPAGWTPVGQIGQLLLAVHLLAAFTSVARLGAIARPDQTTGETAAATAFLQGLLLGPFNVNWFGVDRLSK